MNTLRLSLFLGDWDFHTVENSQYGVTGADALTVG
jgi:hypothetical protein